MDSPHNESSSASRSVSTAAASPCSLPATSEVQEEEEEEAPDHPTSSKITPQCHPDNSRSIPPREGKSMKSSILLKDDKCYVPLKQSVANVRAALKGEDPSSSVVVLHGVPGSGKSSLAKYLAFQLQEEQPNEGLELAPLPDHISSFADGIHFLHCGQGADIRTKQQELLQLFSVKLPSEDASLLDEAGHHAKLTEHLKDRDALVILDDVWEAALVDKLYIPGQLKYLITTQVRFCVRIKNVQFRDCRIEDVGMDDARTIIANYARFRGGFIPETLQGVVDDIIRATGFHPLALASLSTVIDTELKTSAAAWEDLKDNLCKILQTNDSKVGSFGEVYPKSVFQSMMFPVSFLEDDEKTLLYSIALFEGPCVLEHVVGLFLRYTRRWDKIPALAKSRRLASLGLSRLGTLQLYSLQEDESEVVAIHYLFQRFILETKMEEIDLNCFENSNSRTTGVRSDSDIATFLCILYGASCIKEEAVQKMGTQFIWSDLNVLPSLAKMVNPIIELMWLEEAAAVATEVFWKFITQRELHDDDISYLLNLSKTTANATCWFLAELAQFSSGTHYELRVQTLPNTLKDVWSLLSSNGKENAKEAASTFILRLSCMPQNQSRLGQSPSALETLIGLLEKDVIVSIQEKALRTLAFLSLVPENGILILKTPYALERLIDLLSKDLKERCFGALVVLRNLAVDLKLAIRIGESLQALIGLLAKDVEDWIQEEAMLTIGSLSFCDENRILIMEVPHAQERFVKLLRADFGERCWATLVTLGNLTVDRKNAVCIAKCGGALESLVGLLANNVESCIRVKALDVLMKLSCAPENDTLILQLPYLLERLVQHVNKDLEGMHQRATKTIGNLALNQQNLVHIGQFAGIVEALFDLLEDDVVDNIFEAIAVLGFLSFNGKNSLLMLKIPNSLERLAKLLNKDLGTSCLATVTIITNMSSHSNIRVELERCPYVLEALVGLLADDVAEQIQAQAVRALANLSDDLEIRHLIVEIPDALARFSKLLSMNLEDGRHDALSTIENLFVDPERDSLVVEAIVSLLLDDMLDRSMHEHAVAVLMNLSAPRDPQKKNLILEIPHTLERLLKLVNKDSKGHQQVSMTIASLIRALQNAVHTCKCAGALEALVDMLADEEEDLTHVVAVMLLLSVSVAQENSVLILETPNALQSLVKLLSKDKGYRCRTAAMIIANLAIELNLRVPIGECPGALEALVSLLKDDVDGKMQEIATTALTNLTVFADENKFLIIKLPNILERLVKLLRKDLKERCRQAASLLTNLAVPQEIAVRIAECAGALEALVGLLADDVEDDIRKVAAQALKNISSVVDEMFLGKILEIPTALERLVKLLCSDMEEWYRPALVIIRFLVSVPKNKVLIGKCAGALKALVGLLVDDAGVTIQAQEIAISALEKLSFMVENRNLIMETPDALERIVKLLSKDSKDICWAASITIRNLAVDPKNAVHIGKCTGALETLVGLLSEDVQESIQEAALWALANLTLCYDNAIYIPKIPGTLERLISLLSKGSRLMCFRAARVIKHLASVPQNIGLITPFLEDLESLAQQLDEEGPKLGLPQTFRNVKIGEQVEETIRILSSSNENVDTKSSLRYQSNDVKSKDYSRALIQMNESLERHMSEPFIWQERGIVRRLMGDLLGALGDLDKADQMGPDDYDVLKHRALVKYMLKDMEGACIDAERAMQVKHSDVEDNPNYEEFDFGSSSVQFLNYYLK